MVIAFGRTAVDAQNVGPTGTFSLRGAALYASRAGGKGQSACCRAPDPPPTRPVTRFAEDPLLSEDETLRRAALLALGRAPTPDSARAILRALLPLMQDTPALAAPFVTALVTPPMARIAEDPILELMDHAEEAVREQASF